MESAEAILALLERLHTKSQTLTAQGIEQSVSLLYLSRMAELIGAAMEVLPREDSAAACILIRSALECYVDLYNLARDPKYMLVLRAMLLESRSSLFHFKTEPLYGMLVQEYGEREAQRRGKKTSAQFEEALKKASEAYPLLAYSHRNLTVLNRFRIAGMEEKYHAAYTWLSMQAHNAMEPLLIDEAMRREGAETDAAQNDVVQTALFYFAVEMLLGAVQCLDKLFGPDDDLARDFMRLLEEVGD